MKTYEVEYMDAQGGIIQTIERQFADVWKAVEWTHTEGHRPEETEWISVRLQGAG